MNSKLRILIADGSDYMAQLTSGMLKGMGYRTVTTVGDSAAALLALHRREADVLVVDDRLQPVDGVALTRQIRAA